MLKSIREFFSYLFESIPNSKTKNSKPKIDNQQEAVAGITFRLNADQTIDISCYIPETKDLSVNDITSTAEDYAELLMHINEGLLSSKIISFIKETIKKSDHEQDKLFFENVLVFWVMHHVEYLKEKKNKSDQPLIMPSKVFNS